MKRSSTPVNYELNEDSVFLKLSALCASSEHCLFEMSQKMVRWQVGADVQERVLARLTAGKFVDEERYARAFVSDKLRYNKWGRHKIAQALALKRIPADISRRVLDEVGFQEYVDVLRPLIQSKRKSVKASSEYELNARLIRFAMGRGFGMDEIRECLTE